MPNAIADYSPAPGLRKVLAGAGAVRAHLADQVEGLGIARPMIVCGRHLAASPILGEMRAILPLEAIVFDGSRQHTPRDSIDAGADLARSCNVDGLIAIGGSSAVDCAKGIGVLLASGASGMAELHPITLGHLVQRRPTDVPRKFPLITVSTTLSFAEFTGMFGARDGNRKRPYLDQDHVERTIFLDGELAATTPAHVWAETGIKALDDAIFAFCGHPYPEPFLDPLLISAMSVLVDLLPRTTASADPALRQQVQTAVWMTKSQQPRFDRPAYTGWFSTAARHSLGAVLDLPHGVGSCAALLAGLDFHLPKTRARQAALAAALGWTVHETSSPERSPLADGLAELMTQLKVPTRLSGLSVDTARLEDVAEAMIEESPGLGAREEIVSALHRAL